jgi:hydroxymethylbilane synthase
MNRVFRIGTRDSQLAVWQADLVKGLLAKHGYQADLVYIKSEGDTDLKTPLYEIGVQGIFTRALDIALLNGEIDLAVHSMKDVPTQMAAGIVEAAVLERASYKDIFVPKADVAFMDDRHSQATIATSSIRRKAQWRHRFPAHSVDNLRGNVNTRLRKVEESDWQGAIFAAAGLERIGLRPASAVDLDWMLPAPAQGAIIVVCKDGDAEALKACAEFHDADTALCTFLERDFLRALMGGCATPISALAEVREEQLIFRGNILSVDGSQKLEVEKRAPVSEAHHLGKEAAAELISKGAQKILDTVRNAG